MIRNVLLISGAVLMGVVCGHFYSLEVGTARVLDGLHPEQYVQFKVAMDARYQRWIGTLWVSSLVLGLVALATLSRQRGRTFALASAAFAFNVAAFLVLVLVNEPVNQLHAGFLAQGLFPGDWSQLKERWNVGQTARTYLMLAAFVLQLLALFQSRPSGQRPLAAGS